MDGARAAARSPSLRRPPPRTTTIIKVHFGSLQAHREKKTGLDAASEIERPNSTDITPAPQPPQSEGGEEATRHCMRAASRPLAQPGAGGAAHISAQPPPAAERPPPPPLCTRNRRRHDAGKARRPSPKKKETYRHHARRYCTHVKRLLETLPQSFARGPRGPRAQAHVGADGAAAPRCRPGPT